MAAWGPGWGELCGQEDGRKKDGRCAAEGKNEFSHVDRIRSKVDKMYWTVNNIGCGANTSLRSRKAGWRGQGLKLPYLLLPLSALSTKAFLRKWNRKTAIAHLNASDSCISLICNIRPAGRKFEKIHKRTRKSTTVLHALLKFFTTRNKYCKCLNIS